MTRPATRILLRLVFWVVILSFAGLQAWGGRYQPFVADSISYLDMAEFLRNGRFSDAVSSYWSPAYPIVVAIFLSFANPKPDAVFAVMKMANIFILIGTALVFELFLTESFAVYLSSIETESETFQLLPEAMFRALSYSVFAWAFLSLGGAQEDTPDYLLALFIMLACTLSLRIQRKKLFRPGAFALLGLTLGCAYMTKSFASTLAPLMVLFSLAGIKRRKNQALCLLACLATFAVVSAPYGLMLSAAGRTSTILSAAKLNYLWTVLNGPGIMDDYSPAYAHLIHPATLVNKNPKIYYYANPIPGTFPLWYDVGYWTDGVRVDFSPRDSAIVFVADWLYFWWYFVCYVFWSWLIVAFICARLPFTRASFFSMRVPLSVSFWALFCYSVIVNIIQEQPQTQRYFPSYTVMMFVAMLAMLRVKPGLRSRAAIALMCLTTASYCFFNLKKELRADIRNIKSANHTDQDIAYFLNSNGLLPGDHVARLANEDRDISWIKMAGLRLVSTIDEPYKYWLLSPAARAQVNQKLKSLRIKAIVFKTFGDDPKSAVYWGYFTEDKVRATKIPGQFVFAEKVLLNVDPFNEKEGWRKVPNTSCYFLPL